MDAALEAGAEDVVSHDDGSVEVITEWTEFNTVKEALEAAMTSSMWPMPKKLRKQLNLYVMFTVIIIIIIYHAVVVSSDTLCAAKRTLTATSLHRN